MEEAKKKTSTKTKINALFFDVTEDVRREAIEKIIESSSPRKSFFVMITVSAVLCTLGIVGDNAAVIIGGMLIAPMLSPILAVAMGIGMADFKLIKRSFRVVFFATIFSFVFSLMIALLLILGSDHPFYLNHEMELRTDISLDSLLIALVAGIGASLSVVRRELHQYLAGTAIAVALIPPLSMSAIGLSVLRFDVFYQALMQFVFSIFGIILSSLIVFSLSKFSVSRDKADKELEEEEEMLSNGNNNYEDEEEKRR